MRLVPTIIGPPPVVAPAPAVPSLTISPVLTIAPDGGSGSPQGYTPQQIRTAYGFDQVTFGSTAGDGAGQTIAIVDAYDDPGLVDSTASNFSTSDLAQFDKQFGLPDPPSFTKVNEYGATSLPGTDPAGPGSSGGNWEYEEAMDVEWAHALAPSANVVLVEADSNSFGDLYQAIDMAAELPGVSTVSMSWGSSEFAGQTYWDSGFKTPAGHQGVTFVAASGDGGAPGIYPAYSPNVIAAGGTSLTLNADGSYQGETAWSSSGGGVSSYETEPAYQDAVQSTGYRTIPDVAFDADHNTGVAVYDSYDNTGSGPWQDMGGTSLAAPSWAALVAVADQGRVAAGGTTLDGGTQTLPALYSAPSADFHDITSGGNGTDSAGPGYDEVTGLGSPVASSLIPDLAFSGMADQLAIASEPPAPATAGTSFSLTVDIENPDGSIATGASGTLSIAMANNPGGGSLGGTLTATIDRGIATFSNLVIDQAGSGYTLTVSGTGLGSSTTSAFDVAPASTATLVVVSRPLSSIAAGTGFGLTMDVEDAYGNLETGYSGLVTLAMTGGPSSGTLGGNVQATAIDGVATFSGLTVDQAGTGYALTASAPGLASVTTQSFNVAPAQAAKLVVASQPPASVTAGTGFGLTVDVEDAYGNLETGSTIAVTVTLSGGLTGSSPGGTLGEPASGGVATFSGLTIDQAGTGYVLQASATGLTTAETSTFTVDPGAASKLVIAAQPSASVAAGSGLGLTVDVEDPYGNLVTGYGGGVTVALAGGPSGASLGGILLTPISHGVATFSGLNIDRTGSGYTLQASSIGLTTADTSPFAVTPASASQLVIASAPAGVTAGAGFGLTVDVEDAYGNLVTGYGSEVTVGLVGGSAGTDLGGTLSVSTSGGVATFTGLTIDQAGIGYVLQAGATGLTTADTATFAVTPGAASQLVIATGPASVLPAGTGFGLSVDVEDAYGNLATGYGSEVTVGLVGGPAGAGPGGTLIATASGGVATFSGLTIDQAGAGYAIQATGTGLAPATTSAIVVTPAAPAQLVITAPPPSSVTAGDGFGLSVSVEDAFGNLETGYSGEVSVGLSGGPANAALAGPSSVPAVGGVATFTGLRLTEAGAGYTLSSSGSGLTSAPSAAISVTPAAPAQLAIATPPPTGISAGTSFGLSVSVEDAYGNLATSFDGPVRLILSGGPAGASLGGSSTAVASNGVATFSGLAIDRAGSFYALIATAAGLSSGAPSDLGVTPAAPAQLVITAQPPASVTAGSPFGLGVTVEDAYGNVVTSYTGTVSVSIAQGPAGASLAGGTTVGVQQGVGTFSGLALDQAATADALEVTAAGVGQAATGSFQVVPAAASRLVIVAQPPGLLIAGQPFGFGVAAEDAFGNVATTFNGTVTAALAGGHAGGPLAGTTTSSAVNGLATFNNLALDTAGIGDRLEVSSVGMTSTESAPIIVLPGQASHLVIVAQPSASVARDQPFSLGVEAMDAFGNVATGYNGTVTAALSSNPNHGKLTGTLSVQANGGRAVIAGAALNKAGKSYAITITSGGLTPAATSAFHVSNGAPGALSSARRALGLNQAARGSSPAQPPRPPHRTSTTRLAASHRGKR